MENKMKLLYGAVALMLVFGFGWIYTANQQYNEDQVQSMIDEAVTEQQQVYDSRIDELQSNLTQMRDDRQQALNQLEQSREEIELLKEQVEEAEEQDNEVPVEQTREAERVDDLFLGDSVGFVVDDGDLSKLFDGEIEFDSEDYDVHEEFEVFDSKARILYSTVDDEELERFPALGLTDDGAVEYRYVFDDPITMADISDDEPLEVTFLGQELEIVEATPNEVKLRFGEEHYLNEGESVTIDGKEVLLDIVGDNNKVSVCVDGVCETITEYDSETIDDVDVRVEEILSNDRRGSATLVVGTDTLVEQEHGEEFLEEDDSPFEFRIFSNSGELESLVVSYDETHDQVDDEHAPFRESETLAFPYDYLTLELSEVMEDDYVEYGFEFDDFDEELENGTDVDKDECMRVYTDDDHIEVTTEDVEEVYVCSDKTSYYEDTTGDWYEADVTDVLLVNDDAEYNLDIGGADRLRIESTADALIRLDTVWADERFGSEEDEAEPGDILLASDQIGEREYDVLTPFGSVITVPEDSADSDEFTLLVSTDRVETEVSVY